MATPRLTQIAGHFATAPQGLFRDQTAIITGAAQGIGAEAARLFAAEGARVVISDIDAEKSASVEGNIRKSGGQAIAVPGDLMDAKYIDTLVKEAASFGGGKIHIIVNCAGFTWDAVVHKTTDKQWETMLAIHGTGPFRIIRAAAPYFRVKDGTSRCIINVSSQSGLHGNAGQANYALAKAGLVGLTKAVAKEWGPQFGVRVNTVSFGAVLTRLTQGRDKGASIKISDGTEVALGIPGRRENVPSATRYADIPLRRAATPGEAASSILAVASPLFSYVTGQTIEVDGGRNM